MNLHLFSIPGKDDIRDILDASRPCLEGKDDPVVAYFPAGSLGDLHQEYTEKAFQNLARLKTINTELMTLPEMETTLRNASLVYIPGGNTFLLNHRLHLSKIMEYLRKKVTAGLPLVAFSAGTVLCGPNILTSNDINTVESAYFHGLNLTPFNFNCHYPQDEVSRASRDGWLSEYHVFHDNPVVMLEDGAYILVEGRKTRLVRGGAWILRKGHEKHELEPGRPIVV
jgi:dipeptidase E